jgi:hypothetical protein
MQFTIECPPPLHVMFLTLVLYLLVPVGLPLLLWLRRSPRNARDVLLAVGRRPAGLLRRGADFIAWLVPAGGLVGVQVLGMFGSLGMLRRNVETGMVDPEENLMWLVVPSLAAGLMLLAWMHRDHGPRAASDVLHVEHAPRRRR